MSGQTRAHAQSVDRKWPSAHDRYAEQHGLMLSDRRPPADFVSAVGRLLSSRAVDSSWLKLAVACKKANKDWENLLVVLPYSFSIAFATVRPDICPCVTPSDKYVILQKGQARMTSGLSILAIQGVQHVNSIDTIIVCSVLHHLILYNPACTVANACSNNVWYVCHRHQVAHVSSPPI